MMMRQFARQKLKSTLITVRFLKKNNIESLSESVSPPASGSCNAEVGAHAGEKRTAVPSTKPEPAMEVPGQRGALGLRGRR